MRESGVKTKINVYKGLGHCFWTNFPELDVSKTFVKDTVEGIKWLLKQT